MKPNDTNQIDEDNGSVEAPAIDHLVPTVRGTDATPADDTLIAVARHLDLLEPPVTVAIDTTHFENPNRHSDRPEDARPYATLSLVTDDTTLILAAIPLNATETDEKDDLSSDIDNLLAAVEGMVRINRVVAGAICQQPPILDVFDEHDLRYIVRKEFDPVDHDIVTDLAARDETTAATSDTIAPAHDVDHDATVLYVPRPRTATSEHHPLVNDRPAHQYRAFVTNTEVTPATVIDRVADYLKHWLPVETQNATLHRLLARQLTSGNPETSEPVAVATAAYNARQLVGCTDIALDPDAAPSESSLHADRETDRPTE